MSFSCLLLLQVILNSMQKYLPTIRIVCESTRTSQTFQFPETCFIAVTAYQNSKVRYFIFLFTIHIKLDHSVEN